MNYLHQITIEKLIFPFLGFIILDCIKISFKKQKLIGILSKIIFKLINKFFINEIQLEKIIYLNLALDLKIIIEIFNIQKLLNFIRINMFKYKQQYIYFFFSTTK